MSYPIAITRQNPKADITQKEWVEYVRRNSKLTLVAENPIAMAVHIEESKNNYIFETNGVISCDGLSVPIMRDMFQCAKFFNADVVGPRGYVFKSFDDWNKKTTQKRRQYFERLKSNRREEKFRIFRFVFFLCIFLIFMFIIGNR